MNFDFRLFQIPELNFRFWPDIWNNAGLAPLPFETHQQKIQCDSLMKCGLENVDSVTQDAD